MMIRRWEFLGMIAWPALISFYLLQFHSTVWHAILLFYVIPALYLSFRISGQVKKTLIIALAGGTIWSTLNYIWELNHAWVTPTYLPFKFLGVASMENIIWGFLWVYFIVLFYEYFFENDRRNERTTSVGHHLLRISFLSFLGLAAGIYVFKANLYVPYSYLTLAVAVSLPAVFLVWKYHRLRSKLVGVGAYFFYQSLVLELVALYKGYWYFPKQGEFIGSITLANISFPLEEFLFFIAFGSIIVLSWYELFDDDRK